MKVYFFTGAGAGEKNTRSRSKMDQLRNTGDIESIHDREKDVSLTLSLVTELD